MLSTNEMNDHWKGTAATLFNPYINLNHFSSHQSRQESIRTRIVTPTRHSRAPPESIVGNSNSKSKTPETTKRVLSRQFPSPDAAEDVSVYVQQMIHSQFCGRSGTPSDIKYDQSKKNKRTKSTPTQRMISTRTNSSKIDPSRVSDYELDHFFDRTDEQMSRMALFMPGRESTFTDYVPQSRQSQSRRSNGEGLTLAEMCDVASNVGDKMSQSKEKVGLEAIRGFRLPSARLTYEPYEHHPMDAPSILGQSQQSESIRLKDVLTDDNYANEKMIEIIDQSSTDEKPSRLTRHTLKSTSPSPTKMIEFKDWRGKISHPNLPDVRTQLRRDHSATIISPQRPCTAASYLSKSRPHSSVLHFDSHKYPSDLSPRYFSETTNVRTPSTKQRKRPYPLNVRIEENLPKSDHLQQNFIEEAKKEQSISSNGEPIVEPPNISLTSETIDETRREMDGNLRPTPDELKSKSTSPIPTSDERQLIAVEHYLTNETNSKEKNYKLIENSSKQIYRTIPSEKNRSNEENSAQQSFQHLSIEQLELLEHYDPLISAKIGIPFLPIQILARPREAQQTHRRSIQQIEKDYPKKHGQPIFEGRKLRRTNSLIDINQTLQLTKSKRIPVQRQTTFERVENDSSIEETIQIKSLENPHRLALLLYSSPDQNSFLKHMNSTRTSSKVHQSLSDERSTLLHQHQEHPQADLSVVNIRTKQEVDQMRRKEKVFGKRSVFPTSIVTNANLNSPRTNPLKQHQQGRPIPSVFLTEDPDQLNHSLTIYRQARTDVDIKKTFKGFVIENYRKKLSAEERLRREEQQKAAVRIQRAYRKHLAKRRQIETRRPDTSTSNERDLQYRRILSAKRALFVEQKLEEQSKIRKENLQYEQMIHDTGPSLRIYAAFNQIDDQFSKETLNRAATCIQRWWRGYSIRSKWNSLKKDVEAFGLKWKDFSFRYRHVIQRIEKMRQAPHQKFLFQIDQAKDFLNQEKKLQTIFNALSFNQKLDEKELDQFFQACHLSATEGEIQDALQTVLQYYPSVKPDCLTQEIVFDVVYYIYPPLGTGLPTSRKSTWVRPIIDGEDETAIQGTPFLEPIDPHVIDKFLGKE